MNADAEHHLGVVAAEILGLDGIVDNSTSIFEEYARSLASLEGTYEVVIETYYKTFGTKPLLDKPQGPPTPKGYYDEDGPGGQFGLSMVVPPGYPNDSFKFRATSGEHVQVTPQGQIGGGGTVYNIYPTYAQPTDEATLIRDIRLLELMHDR